jgi:hypothetical protein
MPSPKRETGRDNPKQQVEKRQFDMKEIVCDTRAPVDMEREYQSWNKNTDERI